MSDTLNRYAPGSYTCMCTVCEKEFTGDKRSTTCLICAGNQRFNEGMERAADMLDLNYPLCSKLIRKEIDNEYADRNNDNRSTEEILKAISKEIK